MYMVPTIECKSFLVDLHLKECGSLMYMEWQKKHTKINFDFQPANKEENTSNIEMKPKLACSLL
jgi:hypothetical protein